jgi:YggT family protein
MNNPIGSFIYQVTEPLLGLARNIIDKLGINTGMFDFSPLLGIFILRFILYIARSIIF